MSSSVINLHTHFTQNRWTGCEVMWRLVGNILFSRSHAAAINTAAIPYFVCLIRSTDNRLGSSQMDCEVIGIKRHSIQWNPCCTALQNIHNLHIIHKKDTFYSVESNCIQLHCGNSIYDSSTLLSNIHNIRNKYIQFTHDHKQKRHVLFSGSHAAASCTAATS